MTPKEAIEMLERPNFGATWPLARLEIEAIKLGIEALKERQEAIEQGLPLWHELLPGETKE